MILVKITKNNDQITKLFLTGHANFSVSGNDLVCAGVSSIIFGGLNALEKNAFDTKNIIIENNKISIIFPKIENNIKIIIDTLIIQLKTVEEKYPNNIKIKGE